MLERLGVVCKYIFCCGCLPRTRGYSRNLTGGEGENSITYASGPWGDDITVTTPTKKKSAVTSSKNQLTFAIMTVACTANNNLMSPALTGETIFFSFFLFSFLFFPGTALGNIEMLFGPIKFIGMPRIDMVNRRAYYLFSGQERTIDEWSDVKKRSGVFQATLEHLWTLALVDKLDSSEGPYLSLNDNRVNQSMYAEYIVSSEEAKRALYEVPAYDDRGRLRPVAKIAEKKDAVIPLETVEIDEEIDPNVDEEEGIL